MRPSVCAPGPASQPRLWFRREDPTRPVLSAKCPVSSPTQFMSWTKRFDTGVPGSAAICCPPFNPPAWPATTSGRSSLEWALPSLSAHPYRIGGVVEQRAVAIRSGFQLFEERGEQLDVEAVDLRHLLDEIRMAAMMSERMMRIGNADLRIGADASFAAQHHGRNAREVRLKGDRLKIEHQLHIILVLERNPRRFLRRRCHRIASPRLQSSISTSRMPVRYSSILRRSAGPRSTIRRWASSRV